MDFIQLLPSLYKVGSQVYVRGTRGVDPRPYTVSQCLNDGQYKLSRDGKLDDRVYMEERLQLPP